MSRSIKTRKFLTAQSLEVDFQTDWITLHTGDNVGIIYSTSGVTSNTGTFGVEVRMKPDNTAENDTPSEEAALTLDPVPTLAGANVSDFLELNQLAVSQFRFVFATSAVFEKQSITLPALASAADGDYIVITDSNGDEWAIALDTTGGAATTPTGAAWVAIAAGNKDYLDISGATTAATVAALVKTALEALDGFSDVYTITNQGAGVLHITSVVSGPITNPVPHDDDDMGAGSIAGAQVTGGVLANGTCDVWIQTKSIGA